jgi:hypothetical protein
MPPSWKKSNVLYRIALHNKKAVKGLSNAKIFDLFFFAATPVFQKVNGSKGMNGLKALPKRALLT